MAMYHRFPIEHGNADPFLGTRVHHGTPWPHVTLPTQEAVLERQRYEQDGMAPRYFRAPENIGRRWVLELRLKPRPKRGSLFFGLGDLFSFILLFFEKAFEIFEQSKSKVAKSIKNQYAGKRPQTLFAG